MRRLSVLGHHTACARGSYRRFSTCCVADLQSAAEAQGTDTQRVADPRHSRFQICGTPGGRHQGRNDPGAPANANLGMHHAGRCCGGAV
jgi:hypothetical protein